MPLDDVVQEELDRGVLLDPSHFTSPTGIREAQAIRDLTAGSVFIPGTLLYHLKQGPTAELQELLAAFSFSRRPFPALLDDDLYEAGRQLSFQFSPHNYDPTHVELPGNAWNLDSVVDRALADCYAFLATHSALAARNRRFAALLRRKGIAVLDRSKEIRLNLKARPGVQRTSRYLGFLVRLSVLHPAPPAEIRLLAWTAREILVVLDP